MTGEGWGRPIPRPFSVPAHHANTREVIAVGMSFKHLIVVAVIALVAVAIASRVPFLKGLVFA